MHRENLEEKNRRMSIGSIESQQKEIKSIYRYFKDRPDAIESHAAALKELIKDPSIQKTFRRYSDQFRNAKENRLSLEMEKNRKLRSIRKFREEHKEIEDITNKWRDVLLCAFEDLVKYTESRPIDLYNGFHLRSIHVGKDEVGVCSEEEEYAE